MSGELNELVGRAQSGEASALDELVREVRRAVLRYAIAQQLSREDADDLAQEVCVAVLKVVPDWRESGRSMWGYVFTVARNKLTDGVRSQIKQGAFGAQVHLEDDSGAAVMEVASREPGPEDRALQRADTAEMAALLRALPANQREILLLRAVIGLSGRETADVLRMSPGSVRVLQHRAVTKLRSLISNETDAGVVGR